MISEIMLCFSFQKKGGEESGSRNFAVLFPMYQLFLGPHNDAAQSFSPMKENTRVDSVLTRGCFGDHFFKG
jgi:hypothetical protein